MPEINLYIDTTTNQLLAGLNSPAQANPQALPIFLGDTLSLKVWLLQPTQTNNVAAGNPFSIIPTTGLALRCYLMDGKGDQTVYTQQLAFTADVQGQQFFEGSLPLNTQALKDLMQNVTSQQVYLVIGYVQDGLPTTVLAVPILVRVGMPEAVIDIPESETPISAETANATFFPKNPVAGQPFFLMSPLGKIVCLRVVDLDGGGYQLNTENFN